MNSYVDQARRELAAIRHAARFGLVTAATIHTRTARVDRLLTLLAEYEAHTDEEVAEAMAVERARYDAIQAGTITEFPRRPLPCRHHTPTGPGRAA